MLVGYQAMAIGVAARIFAVTAEIAPPADWLRRGYTSLTLERGLIGGVVLLVLGVILVVRMVVLWASKDFGPLNLHQTLRPMLIGTTLMALGSQTLLMSFFHSMLKLPRRRDL